MVLFLHVTLVGDISSCNLVLFLLVECLTLPWVSSNMLSYVSSGSISSIDVYAVLYFWDLHVKTKRVFYL